MKSDRDTGSQAGPPKGVKAWLIELRAPFFVATIVPYLLGTTVAWSQGFFDSYFFIVGLVAALAMHTGTNVANDYFDFKSGNDVVNKDFVFPFTGGSRLLPAGVLSPSKVHLLALTAFGLAALLGLYLALARGLILLVIGGIGILSGYFYTTQFATRGIGEVTVGGNFGPLVVLGSYYLQAQRFELVALAASLPVGLMIANILWINEIPDLEADREVGKKTLVVRLGRRRAADAYAVILALTYLSIIISVAIRILPISALITLITLPIALRALGVARRNYATKAIAPANASTILLTIMIGALLILSFILHYFYPTL